MGGSGWEVQGISCDKLARRFEAFARGEWNDLLNTSGLCDQAPTVRKREAEEQVTRRKDGL